MGMKQGDKAVYQGGKVKVLKRMGNKTLISNNNCTQVVNTNKLKK
jgi:hypothetical protein